MRRHGARASPPRSSTAVWRSGAGPLGGGGPVGVRTRLGRLPTYVRAAAGRPWSELSREPVRLPGLRGGSGVTSARCARLSGPTECGREPCGDCGGCGADPRLDAARQLPADALRLLGAADPAAVPTCSAGDGLTPVGDDVLAGCWSPGTRRAQAARAGGHRDRARSCDRAPRRCRRRCSPRRWPAGGPPAPASASLPASDLLRTRTARPAALGHSSGAGRVGRTRRARRRSG